MKNTRITYQYRDGGNNKVFSYVVLAGDICESGLDMMRERAALDMDASTEFGDFIPGQIGLPDLQDSFVGGAEWDAELDHPFHEILNIEPTTETPCGHSIDAEGFAHFVSTTVWDHDFIPEHMSAPEDEMSL